MAEYMGGQDMASGPEAWPLASRVRTAWPRYATLAAIAALALFLRLLWPGTSEFKADEIHQQALADQIWLDHRLALSVSTSSAGLPETPFIGYLLVIPRSLSADPRAKVLFLALLDAVAVLVTYVAVRRFTEERLAILAAALYAAAPWPIVFSRETWAQVVPLFTVLILWAAGEVVLHRRPGAALLFFPLLALQVQAHVTAVVFLPAVLLTVGLFWPRWRHRWTIIGISIGLLILLPYAVLLVRQWPTTRALLQQNGGHGLIFDVRVFRYAPWFVSGATVTALMGESAPLLRGWEQALQGINWLTEGLSLWGLAAAVCVLVRRRAGWERAALLLIWLIGPILAFVFVRGALGMHYLLILVPAIFLPAAWGWEQLVGSGRRWLAVAGALALAAVLLVQSGAVLAVYRGVQSNPTQNGFGWPLSFWQEVAQGVRARTAAEGVTEVQVLGINDGTWTAERLALDDLLGRQVHLRYVGQGGRPGLLLPTKGEALALVPAADPLLQQALARYGEEVEHWAVPGNDWGVRLYRLHARDAAALALEMPLSAGATFDNGMRLLGARVEGALAPGQSLLLTTYWTFTGKVYNPALTDTVFTHLVDAHGDRKAQNDGFALSHSQWQTGDTLVQWVSLDLPADLPAGDYWLYTGMYSWRDMSRANVVDENGQPQSDGVHLGPVHIGP